MPYAYFVSSSKLGSLHADSDVATEKPTDSHDGARAFLFGGKIGELVEE